jgi:RNA polymerase sigma-70 factor (ECF subfamily)
MNGIGSSSRDEMVFLSNPILWFSADEGGRDVAVPAYLKSFTRSDPGNLKRNHIIELYDSLRPSLFAYLCCLGLSSDEAEDLIQESFLRLVRHLLAGGDERNLRGWLFRVAHNLSMDRFRSGRRQAEMVSDDDAVAFDGIDPAPSPEEMAIKKEELNQLQVAMRRLTAQQRYTVLMRAEGLRYREIAGVLGISTQRVAELVQRALTRLAGDL